MPIAEIAYGAVLTVNGLTLVVLGTVLRGQLAIAMPAFGAAILLHGLGTLAGIEHVEAAVDVDPRVRDHALAAAHYAATMLGFVFLHHLWGAGRWNAIASCWRVQAAFAATATAWEIAAGTPGAAGPVQEWLLYGYGGALAAALVTRSLALRREDAIAAAGMCAAAAGGLHEMFDLGWIERSRELGVVLFASCLSTCMMLRMQSSERQLAALSAEIGTAQQIQRTLVRPGHTGPPAGCEGCVEHERLEAVGGDFHDFLHRDQTHFAGVIADATGHGVQAALGATMIRGAVTSTVELAHDPARVLGEINADLISRLDARLVSVAYAYVNLDAGTMRIGNAGHPPVIVHSAANGRTTQYGARHAAIGASADEHYENTEIPVVAGDRIALYSDGLSEADNAGGGPFGTTRIVSALLETAHLDCRSAAKRIVGRGRRWATAGFHDDVTLMLIDIPPKPAQPAGTQSR